jgi:hypothetical protein
MMYDHCDPSGGQLLKNTVKYLMQAYPIRKSLKIGMAQFFTGTSQRYLVAALLQQIFKKLHQLWKIVFLLK